MAMARSDSTNRAAGEEADPFQKHISAPEPASTLGRPRKAGGCCDVTAPRTAIPMHATG